MLRFNLSRKKNLWALIVPFSLFLISGSATVSAKDFVLKSPDNKLQITVKVTDKIYYDISHTDEVLLNNCYAQLNLRDMSLGLNPKLSGNKYKTVDEIIKPTVPIKFSEVKNNYNSLLLNFKDNYSVEFRAFNDGVAYRFATNMKDEAYVMSEDFFVGMPGDYLLHMQQPGSFKTAYEEVYKHATIKEFKESDKMAVLPMLIDTKKKYKILISESDLNDYPCLFLKASDSKSLNSIFPKVPLEFGEDGDRSLKILKEADYIAKTAGKRTYPWRYFVVTENDTQLLENTMTLKLATQNQLEDTSWIKPGQASWEWWNDASPYGPDVDFVSGFNLATYKYYIDFASKYGIPYIIMDEGWAKSTRDPYTPNPEVNVHEIIRYGKEKNVDVILWLTWLAVENNFDLFKVFEEWGVKGIKIDFMDRSDQWMVNYYERVAKEAAKYNLLVDFHGSFKPSGLEYKYPNVISYEGVRGLEQMGGCFPENTIYLPFIRNAVGPMDFTPGAMINMQPNVYSARRPNSAGNGTRAYNMAMFVVFESGIQMLADNPTLYYKNAECTDFITQVPTVWDETIALQAKVGEYLVVAKRKGDEWFLGGITNDTERDLKINLDFLTKGRKYEMTSFEDGINAGRQAMDYRKKTTSVNSNDEISIKMARNGGWTAVIK